MSNSASTTRERIASLIHSSQSATADTARGIRDCLGWHADALARFDGDLAGRALDGTLEAVRTVTRDILAPDRALIERARRVAVRLDETYLGARWAVVAA